MKHVTLKTMIFHITYENIFRPQLDKNEGKHKLLQLFVQDLLTKGG